MLDGRRAPWGYLASARLLPLHKPPRPRKGERMRNLFRRRRLDRERLVAGLSPRVAEFWPPFWADYDMDDDAWFASFIGWVSGTEKALDVTFSIVGAVGTPLRLEHLVEVWGREVSARFIEDFA